MASGIRSLSNVKSWPLHGLSDVLQALVNVVHHVHGGLRDSGARPEDGAHAALVQEVVVLRFKQGAHVNVYLHFFFFFFFKS